MYVFNALGVALFGGFGQFIITGLIAAAGDPERCPCDEIYGLPNWPGDPVKSAIASVTQIHAGAAYDIIPETAYLVGTIRTFDSEVRDPTGSSMMIFISGG